jgi:hypothetical protein
MPAETFRMSFFQRLFGTAGRAQSAPASQPHSQLSSSPPSQQGVSGGTTRRELLRVVLRDTLHRQGIPADWIGAEMLSTTSHAGQQGVHWRLLVKHWDPRIITHAVALQHALIKRVTSFDPMASAWLDGISWQFALEDESGCPPLPHPGSWTSQVAPAREQTAGPASEGGVIEGPVRIGDVPPPAPESDEQAARADLDQLFAIRDADFRQHAEDAAAGTWAKTEPAKL